MAHIHYARCPTIHSLCKCDLCFPFKSCVWDVILVLVRVGAWEQGMEWNIVEHLVPKTCAY